MLAALAQPHPNIVPFYGSVRMAGAAWLCMEVAEHGSLERLLRSCKRLNYVFTTAAKAAMCQQIAAAMAAMAAAHVLHRDLATRNVLVYRLAPVLVKVWLRVGV